MSPAPVKAPPTWIGWVKDGLVFALGAAGFAYETFIYDSTPRTILVGAYMFMLGLGGFSGVDKLLGRFTTTTATTSDEEPSK